MRDACGGATGEKTAPPLSEDEPPSEPKMHPLNEFLLKLGLFATNLQSQRIAGFFQCFALFPRIFSRRDGPNGKAADLTEREKSDGLNIFLFSS